MHSVLARQLKKLGLEEETPPSAEQWREILKRVERTYSQNDQERYLLERSLAISSDEMRDLYNNLQATSESQLRTERDKLHAIMSYVREGIVTTDLHGRIDSFNSAALNIFGYEEDELRSININQLIDMTRFPGLRSLLRKENRLEGYRKNGEKFILSIATSMIDVSGEKLFITVTRDITSRLQFEEKLQQARESAIAANKAKSTFLANMSHEIRTPLNGVLGIASLLLDTDLDTRQVQLLETLVSSGDTLLAILNDILDFSKIEAGKLDLEIQPLNIRQCLEGAVSLMTNRAEAKGLALEVDVDPGLPGQVMTDSTRLRQVVVNLLSNAIKFTEHGKVSLRVQPLPADPDMIQFSITDSGIGISTDRQTSLFDAFQQADISVTRNYGGTGLGLAICRQLVTLLGGQIEVESTPDMGSTFTFTIHAPELEISESLQTALATAEAIDSGEDGILPENISILVVEDNSVNQMVIVGMLKALGFVADVAGNGVEALQALDRQFYDVVFMDVQMPLMDGVTATSRIRTEFLMDKQPYIIALTANVIREERNNYLRSGMDDYLSKPLRTSSLRASLVRYRKRLQPGASMSYSDTRTSTSIDARP